MWQGVLETTSRVFLGGGGGGGGGCPSGFCACPWAVREGLNVHVVSTLLIDSVEMVVKWS